MVESKQWGNEANQSKGGEWTEDKQERSEVTKSSPQQKESGWGGKKGEEKGGAWEATDNSESWGGGGSSATANTDFGSKDRGQREERPPRQENTSGESTTVFVGGLGYRTTEETVNDFFSSAGTVVGVRIALNQEDNRPRGFCHVEFDTPESAQKAVDTLSGQALDGRNIRIEISRPRGGGGGGRGGGGAGGSRACYKCGEEGHISRECPQAGDDSRGRGRGGGDRGGGGGGSRACFKCNEEGHIARECPQAGGDSDRRGGRGGGGAGGSRACYKCGEEGHIARDCSQEGGDNDRRGGRGGYGGSRDFQDQGGDPYKRSNNNSSGWSGAGGFNQVFGGESKEKESGWNDNQNEGGAWK